MEAKLLDKYVPQEIEKNGKPTGSSIKLTNVPKTVTNLNTMY